ncbi:DNA polymerase III subunit delta [Saccharicrinis sp. FJH54]|uniref:DNA polymerase III subunit delta n=1 Tax=Saccharicrinis sp. FJH54 TaxID=3344665 RepID=UPI0035D4712F
MDHISVLNDLKNRKFKPVYFLMGEEPYYIDLISDYIEDNVLSEMEKEFNQTVMYGRDVDTASVINAAKRFPMMAPMQVVIVKEAQNLGNIDQLEHYLRQPQPSTLLVICYKYGKLDKRKKVYKMLGDVGVVFTSDKVRDYKMGDWITDYCRNNGLSITPKSSQMLAEFLGTDLSKVVNEIDKLKLVMPKDTNEITPKLIEEYIGVSKDYNAFELQEALATRNILKANRIVNYFAANQKNYPMQMVMVPVFNFFSNLMIFHYLKDKSDGSVSKALGINPFFVNQYKTAARVYNAWKVMEVVSLLREYDAKSKGFGNVSSSQGDLLKELAFKIMH